MTDVIVAAGAVVWRRSALGEVEVALIHRPKYDDWSFPKGKLKNGERVPAAAAREVLEETSVPIRLGAPLPTVRYRLATGALKLVRYWAGLPVGDTSRFVPSNEVDKREWTSVATARRRLTHAHDAEVLDALEPRVTTPLVIVRHAKAESRTEWPGPDGDRPLASAGREQAAQLGGLLDAYGVSRVVSSDSLRCLDTVRPYASERGLAIESEPAFSEDAAAAATRERTSTLPDTLRPTVVCTHRPVLPTLLDALGVDPIPLAPAGVIVLHLVGRQLAAVEQHAP